MLKMSRDWLMKWNALTNEEGNADAHTHKSW